MPIPDIGEIRVSQINTELGRTSNTANSNFAGGTTPQTGSLFKLGEAGDINQTAPHAMSEFYGYSFCPLAITSTQIIKDAYGDLDRIDVYFEGNADKVTYSLNGVTYSLNPPTPEEFDDPGFSIYNISANTTYTIEITDTGASNCSDTAVTSTVGTFAGDETITGSDGEGVYLVPVAFTTEAGTFKAHFDADFETQASSADRFQLLFDESGDSNDLADMQVVADSLFVGNAVVNDTSPFDVPPNGTTSDLNLFTYNSTSEDFDTTETGTQSIVITDSVVAADTGNRSNATPNGPSRNSSGGTQVGVQNLVYRSSNESDFVVNLNYADGTICITYTKTSTTAHLGYIRVFSKSGAWTLHKTEFVPEIPPDYTLGP